MSVQYTQAQLKSDVNALVKGKIGILIDSQSTLNQGVRQVLADLDLLTTRRRTALTPNLFSGLFEYAAPTDLKGYGIISVQDQTFSRSRDWSLVPYEQFLRRQDRNTIAVSDYDGIRKVLLNTYSNHPGNYTVGTDDGTISPNAATTISNMDSLTSGGGTWGPFGDVTAGQVYQDQDNFVEGNGSIRFNINAAAGTTAGIVNSTLTSSDMSTYFLQNGQAFIWVYITSTTNLTNFILRLGSSASAYNTKTTTTQADGTAFVVGWNLLRFDLSTATQSGSPTNTAITYCAIYMTKTSAKVSETAYRFDYLVLRRGQVNNLYYYSGYGWQSSSGTYKVDSTTSSDVLNAGSEEYELIKCKCAELAADECDEDKVSQKQETRYNQLKKIYQMNNPSEALNMISTTVDFVKV